jgi:hypothetical protein
VADRLDVVAVGVEPSRRDKSGDVEDASGAIVRLIPRRPMR